jgi:hypothetical protein
MKNPKVRIESDGLYTEVYIDGEKVDMAVAVDFHFYHNSQSDEPIAKCKLIRNRTHESGAVMLGNNEILRETLNIL